MTNTPIRLGIAGLGTVGVGVIKIITQNGGLITPRAGRALEITAVSARSKDKDRSVDLSGFAWEDDPVALAKRDDVDVFVELMGGSEGPAKAATEAALASGKDVVTANKAMLAMHGQALAQLAEDNNAVIRFEAAVAGGIPVIKSLIEGLAGNQITRILGVMNGTCNYILTRMETAGLPYDEVFAEADALGFLEADPNLDVGGIDAGHKLSLLSAAGFGTQVAFYDVMLEGIGSITIEDINAASDMGYRIKLLGVAQMSDAGLEQRMTPCLVPSISPRGQLEGGTNMVILEGDNVGQIVLRGPGAGEGPTASAVTGDIIDVARGLRIPTFGVPASHLTQSIAATGTTPAPFYLRLSLVDRPGALAEVTSILGSAEISVDRMRQYSNEEEAAPVLFVTHPTTRAAIDDVISKFSASSAVATAPVALRIENL